MERFDSHFLMNTEDVKEYCKDVVKYFAKDEDLEAVEIGDGNINYVFKVTSKTTNKSIVVKQSDNFLRSSGRPLDVLRNKIEAEILKIEGSLSPNHVPKIFLYDEKMHALSMEDISEYKNMRKELMEEKTFDNFADEISLFLSNVLLPTTDLVMDRAEKKDNVKLFINKELCDITEDLVLTEPYYNYKNRNIISKGQEKFVEEFLYKNEKLKFDVCKLRDRFMNYAQALIHGDLHSGSIFINHKGIKVIDPEFAFYGPIGYDIGNVIGNLFFSLANKSYFSDNSNFLKWIKTTIEDTFDKVKISLNKKYDEIVTFDLYKNKYFKEYYIQSIISDSIGYAGTEIIRRTVGDSKVMEVSSVELSDKKLKMERTLIKTAIMLIENKDCIEEGKDLTKIFNFVYE
ncbi:S-methyl-5-thioribose kinase [Brachyspira pilosicoli]|uniref:S-methyl-5-thioribose kinase n=1 Tax=Brachyspira pilosicoli TaxID=52584 RepID=A0A5C8EMD2_BRAPL|nr:S-methyl-5-thioribose kinase [Brachyspira pilosicoli]TXJ37290.1 S-methyl-5-thioribose kinase [Brachyspira pilosicoli]